VAFPAPRLGFTRKDIFVASYDKLGFARGNSGQFFAVLVDCRKRELHVSMENDGRSDVVGKWIFDPGQWTGPLKVRRFYARTWFEFRADGAWTSESLFGGSYWINGDCIMGTFLFVPTQTLVFESNVRLFDICVDGDSLSRVVASGPGSVYVRAGTERGRRLWDAAFRKPQDVSEEYLTDIVIEYLSVKFNRNDVYPDTLLGAGGLDISSWDLGQSLFHVSGILEERTTGYLVPDARVGDVHCSKTVSDLSRAFYACLGTDD
jgi:hypothetical protein